MPSATSAMADEKQVGYPWIPPQIPSLENSLAIGREEIVKME
jgi:hypothetical protein